MDADSEALFPSSSSSSSHLRPSLFELLAQEQLRDLLHPVVRYVLSVVSGLRRAHKQYLAQTYPRYFLRILNRHEEFFALLLLAVERHHLKKHNASLSEHFYQLRLVPSSGVPTPRLAAFDSAQKSNLTRRQRWGLLVFLVGLPYARARLQDYYERLGGASDEALDNGGEARGSAMTMVQRIFKLLYPYASLGLDLTLLSYDIAYLFEKTRFYRPWHRLLGVAVGRRVPDELPIAPSSTNLLENLPPLLPPLLLLLKLSQWWYSPSSPRTLSTPQSTSTSAIHTKIRPPRVLPILPTSGLLPTSAPSSPVATSPTDPPPPYVLSEDAKETPAPIYTISKEGYGRCPLCKRKWQNPAVLPSGWVVCWRCGWDAVEGDEEDAEDEKESDDVREENENDTPLKDGVISEKQPRRKGRCPITGVEVLPGQLRRVNL